MSRPVTMPATMAMPNPRLSAARLWSVASMRVPSRSSSTNAAAIAVG
jgi:hypothetical protein